MTKHFRLLGLHFYVSDVMMKRRQPRDRKRTRMKRKLHALLKGGGKVRCEMCGEVTDTPTIHHVYPYGEYPQFWGEDWNQVILCPNCHQRVHTLPELEAQLRASRSGSFSGAATAS